MHAAVTVAPSLVVSQKEEETVTLPLAGVHVIMGEGKAALGMVTSLHSGPLGHGDTGTVLETTFSLFLTLYHWSSLRSDKSGPKMGVGCSLSSEEIKRVSRRKAISHSRFSVAAWCLSGH